MDDSYEHPKHGEALPCSSPPLAFLEGTPGEVIPEMAKRVGIDAWGIYDTGLDNLGLSPSLLYRHARGRNQLRHSSLHPRIPEDSFFDFRSREYFRASSDPNSGVDRCGKLLS